MSKKNVRTKTRDSSRGLAVLITVYWGLWRLEIVIMGLDPCLIFSISHNFFKEGAVSVAAGVWEGHHG